MYNIKVPLTFWRAVLPVHVVHWNRALQTCLDVGQRARALAVQTPGQRQSRPTFDTIMHLL